MVSSRRILNSFESIEEEIEKWQNKIEICQKCDEIQTVLNGFENENKQLIENKSKLKKDLDEIQCFYEDITQRNEKNKFKINQIVDISNNLLKSGFFKNEKSFFTQILKSFVDFLENDFLTIKLENMNNQNDKLDSIKGSLEDKLENIQAGGVEFDLLEQEIEKCFLICSQVESTIKSQNMSEMQENSQDRSKDENIGKETKKEQYFQKIWNLG